MAGMGHGRRDAHKGVLEAASAALLARIGTLSTEKLLDLLEASFPLVGITALRAIPLAILGRLHPVPVSFLKQLAGDRDLFKDLPRGVQRQVNHLTCNLLHSQPFARVLGMHLAVFIPYITA